MYSMLKVYATQNEVGGPKTLFFRGQHFNCFLTKMYHISRKVFFGEKFAVSGRQE